jgi:hypothetical protein
VGKRKKGTPRAPAHPQLRTIFNTHPGGMPIGLATSLTAGARLSSSGLPDTCATALVAANKNKAQRTSKVVTTGLSRERKRKRSRKKSARTHTSCETAALVGDGHCKKGAQRGHRPHGVADKPADSPTPGARFSHTMRNATACKIERKCWNSEAQRRTKKPAHGLGMGTPDGRQRRRPKRAAAPLRQRRPPGHRETQDNPTQREAADTAPLSAHRSHPTIYWNSPAGIRSDARQTGDAHQRAQGDHAAVMWALLPCLRGGCRRVPRLFFPVATAPERRERRPRL